jgi:long-chain acyl-CoA synthetase
MAEVWRAAVVRAGPEPAFLFDERGSWRAISWQEAGDWVEELAAGFLELGVGRGDPVALIGRTRVDWSLCDHALVAIGAIVVPLYPSVADADWVHILRATGARVVVSEDAGIALRIDALRGMLPSVRAQVTMQGVPGRLSLQAVRTWGRSRLAAHPEVVEDARVRIAPDDVLSYVATSGTTGTPKICILTHRNWWAVTDALRRVPGLVVPGDLTVLHLPLAHVFGRIIHFLGPAVGMTIAFCPDAAALARALAATRPTIFASVPRVFEMLLVAIQRRIDEERWLPRATGRAALWAGRRAAARRARGRPVGPILGTAVRVADRLVLTKIRSSVGGRLRLAISGGASLPADVALALNGVGLVLLEGYGLTECTAVATTNSLTEPRLGTVGRPVPGVELAIASDGEILIRGEIVFAGYLGDDHATREAFAPGGWIRTGDVGSLDRDGFLVVRDRKRDILVTARGWNVAPQKVEKALEASRFVAQAMAVGDDRPFIGALIAPDRAELRRAGRGPDELPMLMAAAVEEANRQLGQAEQVRRFVVLDREFSGELGEVTPTLKLRRSVCAEHFRDAIARLYAGGPAPSVRSSQVADAAAEDRGDGAATRT